MTHVSDSPRGHPARRKEITDAARQLAAEQGWPAVTVRAIAGRIGCSAPAIYQYFRDKDAVLASLAAEGQMALATALADSVLDVHGAAKRMRAAVRALWNFAIDNRELYAVMFGLDGLAAHGERGAAPLSLKRIAAELAAKREAEANPDDLADRIAATAHGFVCLALAGGFPGGADRALNLLLDVVDDVVKGLGKK